VFRKMNCVTFQSICMCVRLHLCILTV
jgi:hypothetical protein